MITAREGEKEWERDGGGGRDGERVEEGEKWEEGGKWREREKKGERPKRSEGDCFSVEDRGGGRGWVKSCLRRSQEEVRDKDTSINLPCQCWRLCHLP